MKVLLVDDQESVRSALRCAIELEQNMQVVGELDDHRSLVEFLEVTRPHLLIIDWELLNGDANEFIGKVMERFPGLYIFAMSPRCGIGQLATNDDSYTIVCKSDSPSQLLNNLRAINQSIMEQ
jgi:DNA-binding NarL/FixJ family response regulator